MKKECSLWDRSSTIGARTSALPIAHGWFHPALKMRSKKRRIQREQKGRWGQSIIIIIIIIIIEYERYDKKIIFEFLLLGVSAMPQPTGYGYDDGDDNGVDGDVEDDYYYI